MSARNTIRPPRTLSCVALLVGAALAGSTAGAQAVLDPATQPADTLAPYVLRDTNLEPSFANPDGGTRAYRPWFENGAWSGDLIEYEVTKDGVRVVRNDTGKYPRDGATWRGTQALWSARYKFPDYEAYDVALELDPLWECTDEDPEYWKNRNLFTVANGAKAAFLWNSLTDAQRLALDSATAADDLLDSQQYGSPILSFIRGDRSNERCKSGDARNFRWRFSILGDIINSRPVYAPAGEDGVVVVGANDGMLHGFNATTGVERFGYIPSMLMGTLNKLRVSPYRHTYFVDGELRHRDIGTRAEPRHVVTGGLGAGGKGIFALDVTDPDSPAVLFELAGTSDAFVGGDFDTKIGHIYGRPNIAQLPNGDWYVVTGNGYGTGNAHLVLIRLTSNGTPLADPTYTYVTVDSGANGLSAPALVDATRDGRVDYAYAGDLKGNLWRIDFTKSNKVTKLFAAGATKPITVEPDITRHPTGAGLMVYFGTGSLLSRADASNTSTQSVYGIWDRGDEATVAASSLVQQELVERTGNWTIPKEGSYCTVLPAEDTTESTGRYVIDQQTPNWGTDLGWQVDLPRPGERLIGHPQVRANRLQFTTTTPPDMGGSSSGAAAGAGSWIVQLDLASGGNLSTPRSLFDVNRSCALDAGDHLEIDVGGTPQKFFAVGLNLGPFNIAQPTFGRVKFDSVLEAGVDGVYINALQLPPELQPQQAVQGQLDVTTDSPLGPTWAPVPEPAKQPFALREFPQASGPTKPFVTTDGLGHRVDGHSFGYNKVHGVDYVDLIDLEPRRGKYRLDVGAVYKAADGTYKPITFLDDGVTPRLAERELNRVGEVGIAGTRKFIVMLTNADLSRENEIQIGCRKWPVYEYQTLMMKHLRSANPMAGLAADKLIFTLNELADPALQGCAEPTLRITPTERIGKLDATLATLPGCVNNTDLYNGSPPNNYLTRKSELNADGTFKSGKGPIDLYKTAPHVTRNKEGSGYRWRNGALTVQLLAVKADGTADFTLQDSGLPTGTGIEGQDLGWGGAYAKGFTIQKVSGKDVIVPVNSTPGTIASRVANGMLYELSLFWHWGDMTRFQQQGVGSPVTAFCYGASGNVGPSLAYETEWFTPGAYQQLTDGFTPDLQQQYLALLAQLLSPNEAEVAAAIKALGDMFANDPRIADYHRLRHYVDNSKQLNENHLIDIDRNSPSNNVTVDGTPAQVIDIERDLLPGLGPNFKPGRRSWMDITPEAAP